MKLPFVSRKKCEKALADYLRIEKAWDRTIEYMEKAKTVIHCENGHLYNLTFTDTVLLGNKACFMGCHFMGTNVNNPIVNVEDVKGDCK